MPTAVSGTLTCPDSDRQNRLAVQLAGMIPGAVSIRVSHTDPARRWPEAHARATDAAGEPIALSRTTAKVAARWILRVWPTADWTRAHTLDLTTGALASSGRGR
ncbi:transcriptional regulator [Kitasatospora sp. NBC_01287]|uniref:transcriptional regulator n=1 Tax=Kitasatospora sp. NBC_01287 TaxID=2903573 RepID=UPI00224D397C|nr:transcriptional regulator [Kitasatospora sp. NBC_01287]MCX4751219.1 transcriptional regulator [Kitasatospora sp. NBC_01287]